MKVDIEANGVSYRRFDHWSRQGWIRSTSPSGSGHDRDFPESEVRIFEMMAKLIHIGFRPVVAAELARDAVDKGYNGMLRILRGELYSTGILRSDQRADRGEEGTEAVLD